LARVDFDPAGKPISLPVDPEHPGKNELDLRFRPHLGGADAPASSLLMMAAANGEVAATAESSATAPMPVERRQAEAPQPTAASAAISSGRYGMAMLSHAGPGWDQHREGVAHLARELASGTRLEVQVLDPLGAADVEDLDFVYATGQGRVEYADSEVTGLARMLGRGGVLFAEACANGPDGDGGAREFALSFVELADRLGRQLAEVQRGHPLFTSRHVFASLPAGTRERTRVVEGNGVVYSDADYGCAWQGGRSDTPLARGAIRDALELGVNIALLRHGTV
jgi:hypothetical protein